MIDFFNSRYIIKDDASLSKVHLGNGKHFEFAKLQKAQKTSWHSRPYEYCFVESSIIAACILDLICPKRVLDLACGIMHPGYIAIANIDCVQQVVAIDLDSRLITNDMDHAKVEKFIMDASDIKFSKDYFDAIVCVSALEHMPNWKDVVKEIHRILKPSGMAFVTLDISTYPEKTKQHNVDGKTPDDYKDAFEKAGLHIYGNYNGTLPENAVDTICSKYPLVKDESEFKDGQHRNLKTFKMVLRKE